MDKTRVKAVLFDLDDTLQDRALAFEGYCTYFLSKYFPELTPEQHAARVGQMEHTVNGGYIDRNVYFHALQEDWNWRDGPEPQALSREYDELFGHYVHPFQNSKGTLLELRRRGYYTGIITNGPSVLQNTKLNASGLRPLVDVTIVSSDAGVAKPAPEIFWLAAEKLRVSPQECLYVGDHPVNDVQGAFGAGMQAVWMQYGTFQERQIDGAVPVIQEISQILDLL